MCIECRFESDVVAVYVGLFKETTFITLFKLVHVFDRILSSTSSVSVNLKAIRYDELITEN